VLASQPLSLSQGDARAPQIRRHRNAPSGGRIQSVVFADLHGTVLATDSLQDSVIREIRQKPLRLLLFVWWLFHGLAYFKMRFGSTTTAEPATLPYNADVIDFLTRERAQGREIVLATAVDELTARSIASHLNIFDGVLATSGRTNLKGKAKAERLRAYCRDRGCQTYFYVGSAKGDLPSWWGASRLFLVGNNGALEKALRALGRPVTVFHRPRPTLPTIVRALRPLHWIKNLLVFLPALVGRELVDSTHLVDCALAFVALSACASSVYLQNDLLDREVDRAHPSKRSRPLASGLLQTRFALALIVALLCLSFAISLAAMPAEFCTILLLYYVANFAYSVRLKSEPIVDVVALALFYLLRLLAGGVVAEVTVSNWLLSMTLFGCISIALAKRLAELVGRQRRLGSGQLAGRGYTTADIPAVSSIGIGAGLVSILLFALYIRSERQEAYQSPECLWIIFSLLIFLMGRLWWAASRGKTDDPVAFGVTDLPCISAVTLSFLALYLSLVGVQQLVSLGHSAIQLFAS